MFLTAFSPRTLVLALAVAAGGASALPSQIFFAEDPAPGGSVSAGVASKRAEFLAALAATAQSYGFEDKFNGDAALFNINFTGSSSAITATLSGSGSVSNVADAGRFNTTPLGQNFWSAPTSGDGDIFTLTFSTAISAFGFYGTDIGDFGGALYLDLTPSGGGADETVTVKDTAGTSGALLFFGFADASTSYSSITFRSAGTGTTADFFGFDDFVVADRGQVIQQVPEPGSLALAGLALIGLAGARRVRRRT